MRGRSAFARVRLAGFDSGAIMAISPIIDWAKAVWDGLVLGDGLQAAWRTSQLEVGTALRPFTKVAGPAGAMLASCLRLGWRTPAFDHVLLPGGLLLDLHSACLVQVGLHAKVGLCRLEAAASDLAKRIGGPPNLESLADYLSSANVRGSQAACSLRSLGEGGWWTQQRLLDKGTADDFHCRACGDRRGLGPPPGTLHHRLCARVASSELRDSFKVPDLLAKVQSSLHGSQLLFQHDIPTMQDRVPILAPVVRCCGGIQPPPDFSFTGKASTDGAMRYRAPKDARRAGWSCALVDDNGDVAAGFYGPCADHFPTAFRVELVAVIHLLDMAIPPITVWTGNQEVLDGWRTGPLWPPFFVDCLHLF